VEDIASPLQIEQLPITTAGGTVLKTGTITLASPLPSVAAGPMGLPDILKQQMETYAYTVPPTQAAQPTVGLPMAAPSPVGIPLPPLAPVGTVYQPPTIEKEKPAQIMFNLEDFLQ
jgi:hypothetical protein